jgi:hypothetical protein
MSETQQAIATFRELESQGAVRIIAEPEQENYFDVYGEPDDPQARDEIEANLEDWGCWVVHTEYFDGQAWQWADSIGMCVYHNPIDPKENDYVPDLMRSAVEQYKHATFYSDATITL